MFLKNKKNTLTDETSEISLSNENFVFNQLWHGAQTSTLILVMSLKVNYES